MAPGWSSAQAAKRGAWMSSPEAMRQQQSGSWPAGRRRPNASQRCRPPSGRNHRGRIQWRARRRIVWLCLRGCARPEWKQGNCRSLFSKMLLRPETYLKVQHEMTEHRIQELGLCGEQESYRAPERLACAARTEMLIHSAEWSGLCL